MQILSALYVSVMMTVVVTEMEECQFKPSVTNIKQFCSHLSASFTDAVLTSVLFTSPF
jgi:hypothetical protein